MASNNAPLIRLEDVSKRYGEHDVQALKSICLSVAKGKFVSIMGPSGCGKTTLLNLISGIDRPTAGKIHLGDLELTGLAENKLTELRRDRIGLVFQFFNLLSTLTVRENVELPLELANKLSAGEIRKRSDHLLEEVGLKERTTFYPSQLSGGELQRAAIVRAIIHQPDVILADEPTGNLDTVNGISILKLLQSLSRERGQTILMATHSDEAASFSDEIVHMKDGNIMEVVSN
jgi:putative ABC transport system ATP-binding protein